MFMCVLVNKVKHISYFKSILKLKLYKAASVAFVHTASPLVSEGEGAGSLSSSHTSSFGPYSYLPTPCHGAFATAGASARHALPSLLSGLRLSFFKSEGKLFSQRTAMASLGPLFNSHSSVFPKGP